TGPDHAAAPRVAVDLREDVAEDVRDGKEEDARAEAHGAHDRQLELGDLRRPDEVRADEHDHEGDHHEVVVLELAVRLRAHRACLWRRTSNNATEPAVPALSDSTGPAMGMRARILAARATDCEMPAPSFPTTRATGTRRSSA